MLMVHSNYGPKRSQNTTCEPKTLMVWCDPASHILLEDVCHNSEQSGTGMNPLGDELEPCACPFPQGLSTPGCKGCRAQGCTGWARLPWCRILTLRSFSRFPTLQVASLATDTSGANSPPIGTAYTGYPAGPDQCWSADISKTPSEWSGSPAATARKHESSRVAGGGCLWLQEG